MEIRILGPELASKIAAGEVVERPASVVKELIENSLDAKADQITIEIEGGGVKSIKVIDNGTGISIDDMDIAFHRYATSKITSVEDLSNINSLGFRGEALPSIAAVAEVELSSRTKSTSFGSTIKIEQNQVVSKENTARPEGTTVTVQRLFRHFPARLKFLKSFTTENSHIAHITSQYALAYPEVRFRLFIDKRLSFQTMGDGDLRGVVGQLYGTEIGAKMLLLTSEDEDMVVGGLVSPPSIARSDHNSLSFFVNKRWIRSPLLVKAVEQSYHGLLMIGRHPLGVINLTLPAYEIDVNVHPGKAQVKFHDEHQIFSTLYKAVAQTLQRIPIARESKNIQLTDKWTGIKSSEVKESPSLFEYSTANKSISSSRLPVLRILGQVANTYIVAEGPDGIYIIDQHAAHERVRFDTIMAQWEKQQVKVQGLLHPINLELSPKEEEAWRGNETRLKQFGFTLDSFGERHYLLRSIPQLIANDSMRAVMSDLLDRLAGKTDGHSWIEAVAQSISCHGAIKAGQQLSDWEIRELISGLEQSRQPRTCPHGRPVIIQMSLSRLEKEFGRTG